MTSSILTSTHSGVNGTIIKLSRTEYTLLGTFTDKGEQFFIARRMVNGRYPEYRAIGWNEEEKRYYVHS